MTRSYAVELLVIHSRQKKFTGYLDKIWMSRQTLTTMFGGEDVCTMGSDGVGHVYLFIYLLIIQRGARRQWPV